jgi:hypothetical protein
MTCSHSSWLIAASIFAFGGTGAADAAPFQSGDIFVSQRFGSVARFDPAGNLLQNILVGSTAWGLSFDPTGTLYVAAGSSGVQRFDNNGNSLGSFGANFPGAVTDVGFGPGGDVFLSGIVDASSSWLARYSAGGALLDSISVPAEEGAIYLDARSAGLLLYAFPTYRPLIATTMPLSQAGQFSATSGATGDLRRLGSGLLFATTSGIIRLDGTGNVVGTYTFVGADEWRGVDLDLGGSSFWAADDFGRVRQFDLATGTVGGSFSTGFSRVAGLAIYTVPEPSGFLLVGAGMALLWAVRRRYVPGRVR